MNASLSSGCEGDSIGNSASICINGADTQGASIWNNGTIWNNTSICIKSASQSMHQECTIFPNFAGILLWLSQEPMETSEIADTSYEEVAFYPFWTGGGFPRARPHFALLENNQGESNHAADDAKCRHDISIVPDARWTDGIFTVVCPHQVFYGFHVMTRKESPNDLYTVLHRYFPEGKRPKVVFYDNGCKLHQYVFKRTPHWLKYMRICVDAFHFGPIVRPNHNCSLAFSPRSYMNFIRKYLNLIRKYWFHLSVSNVSSICNALQWTKSHSSEITCMTMLQGITHRQVSRLILSSSSM